MINFTGRRVQLGHTYGAGSKRLMFMVQAILEGSSDLSRGGFHDACSHPPWSMSSRLMPTSAMRPVQPLECDGTAVCQMD
jgi:hypothetical protein